jgi:putative membrane protein
MIGFLIRLLINILGLWVASRLVSGLQFSSGSALLIAALLLGIVNAFVRPVLVLLTLPLTVVTLGLFLLVVNALMLMLVAALMEGFAIAGFGSALLGAIVTGLVSWIASSFVGSSGRFEILVVRR